MVYRCVVVTTGVFVHFHTLRRHRRQYEFEEALEWLDRRHLEEAEGGLVKVLSHLLPPQ